MSLPVKVPTVAEYRNGRPTAGQRAANIVMATPVLQQRQQRGAGTNTLCDRLGQEAGISGGSVRHAATLWRSDQEMFRRVQRGEFGIAIAFQTLRERRGRAPSVRQVRVHGERQQAKDLAEHARMMDLVYRLRGSTSALEELDLERAARGGSFDLAVRLIRESKKRIAEWQRNLARMASHGEPG